VFGTQLAANALRGGRGDVRDERNVESGVGPVCDLDGVLQCLASPIASIDREQNFLRRRVP
jgi:hypothetical protein